MLEELECVDINKFQVRCSEVSRREEVVQKHYITQSLA